MRECIQLFLLLLRMKKPNDEIATSFHRNIKMMCVMSTEQLLLNSFFFSCFRTFSAAEFFYLLRITLSCISRPFDLNWKQNKFQISSFPILFFSRRRTSSCRFVFICATALMQHPNCEMRFYLFSFQFYFFFHFYFQSLSCCAIFHVICLEYSSSHRCKAVRVSTVSLCVQRFQLIVFISWHFQIRFGAFENYVSEKEKFKYMSGTVLKPKKMQWKNCHWSERDRGWKKSTLIKCNETGGTELCSSFMLRSRKESAQ